MSLESLERERAGLGDGATAAWSRRHRGRERAAAAVAFAMALGVFGWGLGSASAWRDEAVTQGVAGRSFGQILALTRHVDLVHLAYYLLARLVHLVTADFVALRALSVLLFAAATAVTVLVGAELGSLRHGLLAAALILASPFAATYAQQARSYALTTFTATLSVLVLLIVLRRDGAGTGRWVGYAAALVVCGLVNAVSLLVLLPHAVAVAARPDARRVLRAWVVAVGGSLLVLSVFLVVALGQRGQVGWLTRPTPGQLGTVLTFGFGPKWQLVVPVVAVSVLACAVSMLVPQLRRPWLVAATWGLVPVLVLWLLSQWHPLFDGRYVAFCLPGAALAVTAPVRLRLSFGPASVRAWVVPLAGALVVALLAVQAWPYQLRVRAASGVEDLRGTAAILRQNAAPGDAVLYLPSNFRLITAMYPTGIPPLDDLTLQHPARTSDTLVGVDRTGDQVVVALSGEPVVWLVSRAGDPVGRDQDEIVELAALHRCFAMSRSWTVHQFSVRRYVRMPRTATSSCRP
jgi:mannosyltransferase